METCYILFTAKRIIYRSIPLDTLLLHINPLIADANCLHVYHLGGGMGFLQLALLTCRIPAISCAPEINVVN